MEEHRLDALRQRVRVLCPEISDPSASIGNEVEAMQALRGKELGFLQFFNTHRSAAPGSPLANIILGPLLGGIAAQLLDASAVRVYQDCIFLKEVGYSETNWHSDLRMAPFDTNRLVTAWIPMRPVSNKDGEDSGLLFAEGSHKDFALPFWLVLF